MISFLVEYIPFLSYKTFFIASLASLTVGLCVAGVGLFLHFSRKKKGKTATASWICMGIGAVIVLNHSVQLLFL